VRVVPASADNGPFLSCFFPAFNEGANIGAVLDEALATLPRFAESFEVIVVDDGSSDDTAAIVREYAMRHPEVRLVSHERNLGYGEALQSGLKASRGRVVFFTDGDRQFRLEDIARLLPAFETADLVAGFRIDRSDPWYRMAVARVYHWALRAVYGIRFHDVDCAFKLIRREVLDAVLDKLESRSAFISPELLIRARLAGFRTVEVGVPHYPRVAGKAKGVTFQVVMRTLQEMRTLRAHLRRPAGTPAPVPAAESVVQTNPPPGPADKPALEVVLPPSQAPESPLEAVQPASSF
jgi:glycosyltransferase involved in cell wall biosynthesis